ncbi:response regulator transcription factor [Leeuwenhoekiella sp. H156]|uniref:response regulator transcription factor n=1 Tax=Leeuwenhoekiella sp. H156 TaxID=3450128 RepID=UPI003FA49AE8
MELIYNSKFLSIHLDDGIMIQEWTKVQLTEADFKEELKNFLELFKTYKPQGALWILDNLDLEISESLYKWVEENILKALYQAGLRKLPSTVPKEKLIYLSIINTVQNVGLVLKPNFFSSRQEALKSIKHPRSSENNAFNYQVNESKQSGEIILEMDYDQLPKVIKHLDKLNNELKFNETNQSYFDQLSFREVEIFKSIAQGKSNRDIAENLCLSESTIATHRKSIIKKLNIKSVKDWQHYADAFL